MSVYQSCLCSAIRILHFKFLSFVLFYYYKEKLSLADAVWLISYAVNALISSKRGLAQAT